MVAGARIERVSKDVGSQREISERILSVDAEWIVTKKDWQEAKKRYKAQEKIRTSLGKDSAQNAQDDVPTGYQPDMDEMRCILYTHGGE